MKEQKASAINIKRGDMPEYINIYLKQLMK